MPLSWISISNPKSHLDLDRERKSTYFPRQCCEFCGLCQVRFSYSMQLGGGVAAIAIATVAIGKDNYTFRPKFFI